VGVPKGTTDAGRADTVRKLPVPELAIADEPERSTGDMEGDEDKEGPEGFVIGANPTDGGDARNTV
jgi:hypothetical protein